MDKKAIPVILVIILVIGGLGYWMSSKYVSTAVLSQEVNQDGYISTYFAKKDTENAPAVVILGGGEWAEYWATMIADSGFIALSLPYQNLPGTQDKDHEIPLEYFEAPLKWLGEQNKVDSSRVILMGASQHAAAALKIASTYPELVHGVIAYAPANMVWSTAILPHMPDKPLSPWSLDGTPVPFRDIPKAVPAESGELDLQSYWDTVLTNLKNDTIPSPARIAVEKINGPILLLSGMDDAVWPSARMADAMEGRARALGFNHEIINLKFENAGHLITGHPDYPANVRNGGMIIDEKRYEYSFGGTEKGDKAAQLGAKSALFEYLSDQGQGW